MKMGKNLKWLIYRRIQKKLNMKEMNTFTCYQKDTKQFNKIIFLPIRSMKLKQLACSMLPNAQCNRQGYHLLLKEDILVEPFQRSIGLPMSRGLKVFISFDQAILFLENHSQKIIGNLDKALALRYSSKCYLY